MQATLEFEFDGILVKVEEDPPHGAVFRTAYVQLDDGAVRGCRLLCGHPLPCASAGDAVTVRRFSMPAKAGTGTRITFDDMEPLHLS